ncbi:MAG: hypothetical protein EBR82_67905 [Caulobacteraceae bacterium]|nr:hypothetical protein [Caulobacteraceae bacterium]
MSQTAYTFNRRSVARTPSGVIVVIPDQVEADQHAFDSLSLAFPALRLNGQRVRVKLRGDLYGLWTPGTGDPVVTIC